MPPHSIVIQNFFNPRHRSLVRGNLIVLLCLAIAFPMSDFPNNRQTLFLILPALGSMLGTVDSIRCMQRRWSWYHGGVLLCIYMDLMVVSLIFFFWLYPYAFWLSAFH